MIACGPLQAMYIMAAGTGSVIEGGKLLLIFALGTLPAMIGFSYLSNKMSAKFSYRMLKASGFIVIVLGLIMINRALALTGTGYDANSIAYGLTSPKAGIDSTSNQIVGSATKSSVEKIDGYQIIRMNVTRNGWEPDTFALEEGVPVKWIIDGQEITNCNKAIQVPKYGLKFDIKQGEQTIEFTPTETGVVSWSCWMGMIPGKFIVTEPGVAVKEEQLLLPQQKGGCGCGGTQ